MNFYDLCNKMNGVPYQNGTPPPVKYEFANYLDAITNDPRVNGTEDGSYELKPIDFDDMKRYAADDVADVYKKMHGDKSPLSLGKPMTDEELRKFTGMANHPK